MQVEETVVRNKEERVEMGHSGRQDLAQKPPGVHVATFHSNFCFPGMSDADPVPESLANSKLVRFHGRRRGAGGKSAGGVLLSCRSEPAD